jgi:hypothetical protein
VHGHVNCTLAVIRATQAMHACCWVPLHEVVEAYYETVFLRSKLHKALSHSSEAYVRCIATRLDCTRSPIYCIGPLCPQLSMCAVSGMLQAASSTLDAWGA